MLFLAEISGPGALIGAVVSLAIFYVLTKGAAKAGVVEAVKEISGKLSNARYDVHKVMIPRIREAKDDKAVERWRAAGLEGLTTARSEIGIIAETAIDALERDVEDAAAARLNELGEPNG